MARFAQPARGTLVPARRPGAVWSQFIALFSAPFIAHPEWLATLTVPQQEQRRRQALLRLTIVATNILVLGVALPAMLANATPPIVVWTTLASGLLGIPCLALNGRSQTTLASLIFLGIFYVGLVPNIILRNTAGFDVTSLASFCYFTLLLVIAGLILPIRWLLVTAALVIATTIICLVVVPIDPRIVTEGYSVTALRFSLGGIFVTLELFVTTLSWIVARTTLASLQGAQRAFDRAHELTALKDQFIVNANHELRTPVMALYGNIEFLATLGDAASATQRQTLMQRALQAGDTLLGLLNTIFDASLMEGEQVRVVTQPVALAPLVRAILASFDPREIGEPTLAAAQYQARDVTITITEELLVVADEKRLRQVLLNLLTNALKYSAPGSPIAVTAEIAAATMVRVTVRDYGLGVPPAEMGALFQRFARLPRDVAGTVRGTGLGLYLCRLFIEAMGGQIWVESEGVPGAGAAFIFTLPLAQNQAQ